MLGRIILFFISFLIFARFTIDPDFGWHLALGREFIETGTIVRADTFSWTMPGYLWGNSYFLYQVILAFIFANFGYLLLSLLFAAIAALAFVVLAKDQDLDLYKVIVVLIGLFAIRETLGVRPHTISFLFFSVLLVFLERGFFERMKSLPLIFIFFLLWANLHRGFIVGLLVAAVYLGANYLYKKSHKNRVSFKIPGIILAVSFLATLLTPFPISLWQSGIVGDISSFDNFYYIAEWLPTVLFFPTNVFFFATGVIFIYIFFKQSKKIEPTWFLMAAFIYAVAFVSAAFLLYWGAIFTFIVCRYLDLAKRLKSISLLPVYSASVAAILILFLYFLTRVLVSLDLESIERRSNFPVDGLNFIRKENLGVNLLNEFGWGGYIDWKTRGEVKVFIDGRMSSWVAADGISPLRAVAKLSLGDCSLLEKYPVKVALIEKKYNDTCFQDFKEVYKDNVARVLVR